ncbi:MAG: Wzz/FepE/Etk N-terminal domain-containing protein [Pseudomonadota bacterium]
MEEAEIDIRAIFGVLRRQARLIWLTVILVVGAALVYVFSVTPLYRAETLILVDPSEQNLLDPNQQASAGSAQAINSRVESEVEILRSMATALAVVRAANLVSDEEFGPRLSTVDQVLAAVGFDRQTELRGDDLVKNVVTRFTSARDVRRRGLTYIIGVGVTSEDPTRAAELANTLAEIYISRQVESKVTGSLAARDILQGQISSAQSRLVSSEERLDNFIFDNLDRLGEEADDPDLEKLRAELLGIQDTRQSSILLAEEAQAALSQRDWTALSEQLGDQALAALAAEREQLQRRLGNVDEGTPLQIDLRTALAQIDENLETRGTAQLAELQLDVTQFEEDITSVRDSIRNTLLRSDLSSTTLAEIFSLQQSAELSRLQVQTLLTRLSDLEAQSAVQIADSRIVSEALPPTDAAFPNRSMILAIALVMGVGLGAALAFANEYYVGGITSDGQLENLLGVPVVASIPAQTQEKGQLSVSDVVVEQPLSAYAEGFRQLRASIDQELFKTDLKAPAMVQGEDGTPKKRGKVILVTSSIPVEGKSTTALALARTYALSGKKTVLVDGDMRKPSLARQLGVRPTSGLLEFLSSDSMSDEDMSFFVQDSKTPLQALLGGRRSDKPTDQLLVSDRFRMLLDHACAYGEVIVIDSPPVVPVVDARYIAPQADVVLMVARFAATTQSDIRYSIGQIKSSVADHSKILGMLNYEERKGNSYRYQGYYSDYVVRS